jgi:hypothetical protein
MPVITLLRSRALREGVSMIAPVEAIQLIWST